MKKTFLALSCSAALLLTACSFFDKLSEEEYNNQIVEDINKMSTTLEKTATLYTEKVPNEVDETDTIDVSSMQTKAQEASDALKKLDDLLNLESRNIEQQNAVRTDLSTYQSAAEQYLESYTEMLNYYSEGQYQKEPSKVEVVDEELHAGYTTFIQANNDLVDNLEIYVPHFTDNSYKN